MNQAQRLVMVLSAILLPATCYSAAAATVALTPPVSFAKEYIRELSEIESIRSDAEVELKEKDANQIDAAIHISTRYKLAFSTHVGMMESMHLGRQSDSIPQTIIAFDKQKIEIHDRLVAISTEFISGPKPGVDYGKLYAEVPQLRAQLEHIDEFFMKISALVFTTLMDEKPDSKGHMSRLAITSTERKELLDQLQTSFGKKLDLDKQPYMVSAASVLRAYLSKEKGYKASDEPE